MLHTIFNHEIKNEISNIKQYGMWPDQTYYALKYLFKHRDDVYVIGKLHLIRDQQNAIPDLVILFKRYHYVVFSLAVNDHHQIAIVIDNDNRWIKLIDSQNHAWRKNSVIQQLCKNLSALGTPYQLIEQASFFKQQKDDWSCGVHVVANCLQELGEAEFDKNNKLEVDCDFSVRQHNTSVSAPAQLASTH